MVFKMAADNDSGRFTLSMYVEVKKIALRGKQKVKKIKKPKLNTVYLKI